MEIKLARFVARRLFFRMLEALDCGHLEILYSGGTRCFGPRDAPLRATVAIHHDRFFARALTGGDVGMGESYMDGDWSTPDLVALVRLAVRNLERLESSNRAFSFFASLANTLFHRRNPNTINGSRRNIARHYDLGNDFYRLFLDSNMAYSCAYYDHPEDSLERAQIRKFDLICRKLQLGPQDHLLEIGTGWGAFAAYAAGAYRCRITTTTISRQQHAYARDLFASLPHGAERIELLSEDYRHLRGQFDKIVSIEMFEAVGYGHYDDFFGACDRLLRPGGVMLLQTITMNERRFARYRRNCDWIQKHIFPGAELASVAGIFESLGRATRLGAVHSEDIGMHYAATLGAWRERFLARLPEVERLGFDARFIRMWDYYLAYCEGAFRERYIGDVQLLLAKTPNSATLFHEPRTALFAGAPIAAR